MSRLRALLLMPALFDSVLSIQFYLPVNSRKCLQEELRKNVLVGGEYEVSEQPETRTNLQITDFLDQMLYAKENATKGKFSFTTEYDNLFDICFDSRSPMGSGKVPDQLITLNMQHGVETMTEKEIEKVEKLTPLEAKLRRLELLAKSIADDMTYLRERGKEMRVINASTSTRVQLFSIISMCCLSALALWQVFYLRRFFKVKKLIE